MYHDDALETSNTNRAERGDAGLDLYFPCDLTIKPRSTIRIDFKIQCEGLHLIMITAMYVIIFIQDQVSARHRFV